MAYDANLIGKPREIVCFVVKESTQGTLAFPSGSHAIYLAGNPEINQQPLYTNSPEIVNTLDVLARVQDMTPAGTWSIPALVRPSGTQGMVPPHDVLFECLAGAKDVQASYVDYLPSLTKDSFSIWWGTGPLCRFAKGCTVSDMRLTITNRGYPQITFSGGLMWAGFAGRTQMAANAAASDTTISVDDASRFSVGARIWNVDADDNNSGQGYEVTAVDTSANTLTISPGIADAGGWSVDEEIAWFLPDASPATSYAVAAKDTTITIGGVTKAVKSIDLTISSPVMYLEDEITTESHPISYLEQQRNLRGEVSLNVRPADLTYFKDPGDSRVAVQVVCGSEDGKRMTVTFNYAALEIPSLNVQEPIEMRLGFQALGSSGEDSFSIRFN